MAKQKRGGLGRGINSLLGESLGEIAQKDERIEQRDDAHQEQVPMQSSQNNQPEHSYPRKFETEISEEAVEKATIKERPAASSVDSFAVSHPLHVEQNHQHSVVRNSDINRRPYIEEDDHVTIKGVVSRETTRQTSSHKSEEVPIDQVFPNPDQPRTHFNPQEIDELAQSIEREGLLQPVLVRKVDNGYQIIAGERRWQACKKLQLKTIPIREKNVEDDKALELALIENIQRSDLNPIEEAYGYKRLMERKGMTQSEVAQAVSKGRSTIANALRLLELPEDAQQLLFEEKITAGHARAILSIPTPEGRAKLTQKLKEEKLSVRETEAIARLLSGQAKSDNDKAKRVPLPASYKRAARELRETLQTNVRIKTVKGKNKIEIEFKDESELERLFERLSSKIETV